MMVVGITGSFGTGKTFVASIFKSLGAKAIDADLIAHEAIGKGREAYNKIVALFGREILMRSGRIDRRALSDKVFASPKNVKRLNAIVHPRVIAKIKDLILSARSSDLLVIDAPLLLEAGLDNMTDKIIVVSASRRRQIERCKRKFDLNEEEVRSRIKCQLSLRKKMGRADYVIDNNGSRTDTRKQVERIWRRLKWR